MKLTDSLTARVGTILLVLSVTGGCATDGQSNIGKVGGAAAGAAVGSLIGGGKGNTLAIVGGALLGGYAGDRYYDKPREAEYRTNQTAQRQTEYDQKLAYERQSQLQQAEVQRQIDEQRMYEQWKQERNQGGDMSTAEIQRAQRLLRGLGYYNGPIDGVVGSATTRAVKQFQSANGMTANGLITPSLVSQMEARI